MQASNHTDTTRKRGAASFSAISALVALVVAVATAGFTFGVLTSKVSSLERAHEDGAPHGGASAHGHSSIEGGITELRTELGDDGNAVAGSSLYERIEVLERLVTDATTGLAATHNGMKLNTVQVAANKAAAGQNAVDIQANMVSINANATDVATNSTSIQGVAKNLGADDEAIRTLYDIFIAHTTLEASKDEMVKKWQKYKGLLGWPDHSPRK